MEFILVSGLAVELSCLGGCTRDLEINQDPNPSLSISASLRSKWFFYIKRQKAILLKSMEKLLPHLERLNFILKRAGMFNAAETKSFSRNLLVNYILTDPGQHLELKLISWFRSQKQWDGLKNSGIYKSKEIHALKADNFWHWSYSDSLGYLLRIPPLTQEHYKLGYPTGIRNSLLISGLKY